MGTGLLLGGCASAPKQATDQRDYMFGETQDPWEHFNRTMYRVNYQVDRFTLRPAAVAYVHVVPHSVRGNVRNILSNLASPIQLANDMLEGKPRMAGNSLMRFVINSTLGGLGAFDVAKRLGYAAHPTDTGITLALWGVRGGPYLYLPVLGPGDPRDSLGRGVDLAASPFGYLGSGAIITGLHWGNNVVNAVSQRAEYLGTLDQIRKTALDPYATFRSLYRQHRQAEIAKVAAYNKHTVPAWFPAPKPGTENDAGDN